MVSATLSFLRDDSGREEAKVLHFGARLETICNDLADAGRPVTYDDPTDVTLRGRPFALKRAFTNLIDNAVMFGGKITQFLHHVQGRDPCHHSAGSDWWAVRTPSIHVRKGATAVSPTRWKHKRSP